MSEHGSISVIIPAYNEAEGLAGAFKPMASHMQALDERENLQRLNVAGALLILKV